MYCHQKILCISWTDHKTNREICDKLRIEKDLLQRAIQMKLLTVRPCTQDGGQQEVKDTDVQNSRRNE